MTEDYYVGGYIAAMCSKCKMELGHTIAAMIDNLPTKVICNTCKGQHKYRPKPSEIIKSSVVKKTRVPRKTKAAKELEANIAKYMSLIKDCDLSNLKKYDIKDNFEMNEIIEHPKFGVGIVLMIIQKSKIEILFKEGPKLLIQNY